MDRRLPERTAWLRRAPIDIGAGLLLASTASAMDPEGRPIPLAAAAGADSGGSALLPIAVTLIALGVACWFWSRRRSRLAQRPAGCIAVLDRASMGRGRALSLIRVGDRVVLVGEGPQGFQRLAEFDAEDPPVSALEARRLAS